MALGHLAVIDAPAAAGLGVAFWAVAELTRADHRSWLVVAAALLARGPGQVPDRRGGVRWCC